jgi:hypothetical protein
MEAIRKAREANPAVYLKVVASIIPKHLILKDEPEFFEDMSEDELGDFLNALRSLIDSSKVVI